MPTRVMILTNVKLEVMAEALNNLVESSTNLSDGEVWLANRDLIALCEEDLRKAGIKFEPDWKTNPNSRYAQRIREAILEGNVYMPTKTDTGIACFCAREGRDFEAISPGGFIDLKPLYDSMKEPRYLIYA